MTVSEVGKVYPPVMSSPEVGDRVTVEGQEREGSFLVLLVHTDQNSADLLRLDGVRRIEEGVPLQTLRPATAPQPAPEMAGPH
jgi:hypothetical protein